MDGSRGGTGDGEDNHEKNTPNLQENCVEYSIFPVDPKAASDPLKQLSRLEDLRKSALQLASSLTADYIWQKGLFTLDVVTEQGNSFLRGTTDYGDAIEDEWLIVFILRELSKAHPTAWIRVFDADGEFLLIEAANVLPKWLSPETDHNRVWINNGRLRIIPHTPEDGAKIRLLPLSDALRVIKSTAESLLHSEFIEAEAFYRLEKYPDQIRKSIHHSLVTIPRRLVHVLRQTPKAVAPAVESFYLRDALDLNALLSSKKSLTFPPVDLVTVSVRFSRVLFAQLRSQRFEPPAPWTDIIQRAKGVEHTRLEIGMKLACGFEIMLNNVEKADSREARAASIVVEDLEEDGDSVLPTDEQILSWKDAGRNDDESWMDINYEDFERELSGRQGGSQSQPKSSFGDATTQADLRKIVSRFEAFLNDENAGLDGAEIDEMDIDDDDEESEGGETDEDDEDEDKAVSFDEAEFSRMMREMMGLAPAESDFRDAPGKSPAATENAKPVGRGEESDDDDLRKLTAALEAELNEHGALKLDQPQNRALKQKNQGKKETSGQEGSGHETSNDEEADDEVDIDYNLAKNLLESFKGQSGMPGPAGNILGMMGLQLPRDEDDNSGQGK
ncbi:SGT1 protein-domain-containing protein [Colletotrichum godetiae]|uniref:SGT1 protein-domain-containing protein n=1 Tax=Colletotrichum godetiae TaxID=1209918 RepID=A0AAJ0A6W0_9PEZI|nr:SGT1 protein-domain-containing protein [Colletotrichum godetiae]KAK1657624.1 SGT1 protein-domain-containing protein [Colletotrichum godetiae]